MDFRCEKCALKFGSASILKLHHRIVHESEDGKLTLTQEKDEVLKCQVVLKRLSEDFVKNFLSKLCCQFCYKVFKKSCDRLRHENVHLKPFNCRFCDEKFAGKRSKLNHEQKHFPYKCQICQWPFSSISAKLRHEVIHYTFDMAKVTDLIQIEHSYASQTQSVIQMDHCYALDP